MVALIDDKAILWEIFPFQGPRVSSQKPENLWLGSNHISNSGTIAQVRGSNLAGDPVQSVQNFPVFATAARLFEVACNALDMSHHRATILSLKSLAPNNHHWVFSFC